MFLPKEMRKSLTYIPRRGYKIDSITQKPASNTTNLKKELSFRSFNLLHELVHVLEENLMLSTPTPIQHLAIPHLLAGNSAMLAA
jgi:superfamily II DNA/RNA helicase